MNIDPLNTSGQTYSLQSLGQNQNGSSQPAPASAAKDESDSLSAELTDKVRASLAAMPEIRPEMVERGRQLLGDANYPSKEIIDSIAGMITPFSEE